MIRVCRRIRGGLPSKTRTLFSLSNICAGRDALIERRDDAFEAVITGFLLTRKYLQKRLERARDRRPFVINNVHKEELPGRSGKWGLAGLVHL